MLPPLLSGMFSPLQWGRSRHTELSPGVDCPEPCLAGSGCTAQGGCLCHFPVAVLQHRDTGNCRTLRFILAYGAWGKRPSLLPGVRGHRCYLWRGVSDSRHMRRLELEAECTQRMTQALELQSLPPVTNFLQ